MKFVRCCVVGLCLVAAAAPAASADGWLPSYLNPFAKKDARARGRAPHRKHPAVVQQLSGGTKKVVTGATDLVTLKWLGAKDEPNPGAQSRLYDRRSEKPVKEESGPGPFGWLFREKEPERPKSLSEWMAQKRPEI